MAQPLPTLNLIGAGRVGQTLAHLWMRHGLVQVQDVLTRSMQTAQTALAFIAPGVDTAHAVQHIAGMRQADLWLLAVPDAQIGACAQDLAALARQRGDAPALALHCSGARGADLLQPLREEVGEILWSFSCPYSNVPPAWTAKYVESIASQYIGSALHNGGAPASALQGITTDEEKREVFAAMLQADPSLASAGWGGGGHFFTCPSGHVFAIGECGGAMEVSRCPECGATIGGSSHRLAEGNQQAAAFLRVVGAHR